MSRDTSCLYSTVRNTSGGRKKFGFLPPHGRELAANEEFTVFGNVQESVIRMERVTSRRNIQAFEAAISREDLLIVNTPSPIFEDRNGHSKMLHLDGAGNLSVTDPCWQSTSDNAPAP
jgi:hypothetical protein